LSKDTVDSTGLFRLPGDCPAKHIKFGRPDANSSYANRLAFANQQRAGQKTSDWRTVDWREGNRFAGESSGAERLAASQPDDDKQSRGDWRRVNIRESDELQ
jgi:hypothetical protein